MARLTIKAALKLFMFWLGTWSGEFYGLSRVKVTFLNVTNSLNNIKHTDFMDITTITMEILYVGNKVRAGGIEEETLKEARIFNVSTATKIMGLTARRMLDGTGKVKDLREWRSRARIWRIWRRLLGKLDWRMMRMRLHHVNLRMQSRYGNALNGFEQWVYANRTIKEIKKAKKAKKVATKEGRKGLMVSRREKKKAARTAQNAK
ncbi:hypothetical protein BKA61DRAFT_666556 [Leptodontidium sp. MPI-SDFR-AT-0119]|nr:hypothetical protein BKA61DRAFT_666556 [Leptodontidium sp. MPI-SDFR-AT-0119]